MEWPSILDSLHAAVPTEYGRRLFTHIITEMLHLYQLDSTIEDQVKPDTNYVDDLRDTFEHKLKQFGIKLDSFQQTIDGISGRLDNIMFQQNLNAMSSTNDEAILFFKTQLEAYKQTLTKMEKDLSFTTALLEGVNNLGLKGWKRTSRISNPNWRALLNPLLHHPTWASC